ncbi:MAG: hypothetical protein ABI589_07405, partial [Burkholderiales bacterium]
MSVGMAVAGGGPAEALAHAASQRADAAFFLFLDWQHTLMATKAIYSVVAVAGIAAASAAAWW